MMLSPKISKKRFSIAITLVLLIALVALVLTVGSAYGQNVYQTNILAPLFKAFQDPINGIIKSYDVQWTAEPLGSTDTFISVNDQLGDAYDAAAYSDPVLTLTRVDGQQTVLNIGSGGGTGTGTGSPITSIDSHLSSDKITLAFTSGPGSTSVDVDLVAATTSKAGVMTAFDKTKLDGAVTSLTLPSDSGLRGSGTTGNVSLRVTNPVLANPTTPTTDTLTSISIGTTDYALAQGAQGIFIIRLYTAGDLANPPAAPTGTTYNVQFDFLNGIPAGWARTPSTPNLGEVSFVTQYEVNPATVAGTIITPVWSTPSEFSGMTGPTGLQGTPGIQGVQGITGATGVRGPPGADGTNGTDGTNGATGPQGPTGAQGPTGSQGPTGPRGATGSDGSDGTQGTQGASGADGATGATGSQGQTGPQGQAGSQGPQGRYEIYIYQNATTANAPTTRTNRRQL